MTGLAARVAALTTSCTTQAQGGAVGLNMAETLAVVALLCLRSSRERALIGLVTRLLACRRMCCVSPLMPPT